MDLIFPFFPIIPGREQIILRFWSIFDIMVSHMCSRLVYIHIHDVNLSFIYILKGSLFKLLIMQAYGGQLQFLWTAKIYFLKSPPIFYKTLNRNPEILTKLTKTQNIKISPEKQSSCAQNQTLCSPHTQLVKSIHHKTSDSHCIK